MGYADVHPYTCASATHTSFIANRGYSFSGDLKYNLRCSYRFMRGSPDLWLVYTLVGLLVFSCFVTGLGNTRKCHREGFIRFTMRQMQYKNESERMTDPHGIGF